MFGRKNKLLAGAFEDLENNLPEESLEEQEKIQEAVEERVENIQEESQETAEIEAIEGLASDIEQEAINIEAVESGESDPNATLEASDVENNSEELQEQIIDQEAALESYSKVLTGLSRKSIKQYVKNVSSEDYRSYALNKLGISTESLVTKNVYKNSNWERYKQNHAAKVELFSRAIEEFAKDEKLGMFTRLMSFVSTNNGEAEMFRKKGQEIIDLVSNKEEINPEFSPSARTELFLTGIHDICADNFLEMFDPKSVKSGLKKFPNLPIKELNGSDYKDWCPIGMSSNGEVKQESKTSSTYKVTAVKLENETPITKDFIFTAGEGRKYKSKQDILKDLDTLNAIYQPHAKKVASINKDFDSFLKNYSAAAAKGAGAYVGAKVGAALGIVGLIFAPIVSGVFAYKGAKIGAKLTEKGLKALGLGKFREAYKMQLIYRDVYQSQCEYKSSVKK